MFSGRVTFCPASIIFPFLNKTVPFSIELPGDKTTVALTIAWKGAFDVFYT